MEILQNSAVRPVNDYCMMVPAGPLSPQERLTLVLPPGAAGIQPSLAMANIRASGDARTSRGHRWRGRPPEGV
jgi:hypothetical protein